MATMVAAWPMVALGEVLTQYTDYIDTPEPKLYPKLSVKLYGRGVVLDTPADGTMLKMQRHQIAHAGQVILSEIWGKKGAIGLVPPDGEGALCTSHFFLFNVRLDRLDSRWLQAIFSANYLQDQLDSEARGTTGYAAVRPRHLLAATIPLPPLDEQRRIVARIEELAARIEQARGLRREAAEEAELVLTAILKRIRSDLLERYPRTKLGQIASVTAGGTPSREVSAYWGGDIPWIKTGELVDGNIQGAEEYVTEEGLNNSSAKLFPIDTILVALYGQGQTRGRTGRLCIPAATNQACCAILPTPSVLEPRYTQYWLRSLYYEMREESHGGAQPNWNGQMVKDILMALPPLEEQRRIVGQVDEARNRLESLRRLMGGASLELDSLLPSVLDKAFRGEL